MTASAEVGGDSADIHIAAGAQAYLELTDACLVHENGNLHALCQPELVNNPIQILVCDAVEVHLLPFDCAEHTFSIHKQNALQKGAP